MDATEDYCELCDLPLSQCIHGRPPTPPPPAKAATVAPKPRKRPASPRATPAAKVVSRRWTPPEALKPLILSVLAEAGGQLDADDLYLELEIAAEDRLLPGDHEKTPGGELRWQYAARRARLALIDEGLMVKAGPGIWKLAP